VAFKNANWELNLAVGKKVEMIQKLKNEVIQVKKRMREERKKSKIVKRLRLIREIETLK